MTTHTTVIDDILTPAALAVCTCPVHGVLLVRTESGWTCARGFGCVGMIGDALLQERMRPHLRTSGLASHADRQRQAAFAEIKRRSNALHQGANT